MSKSMPQPMTREPKRTKHNFGGPWQGEDDFNSCSPNIAPFGGRCGRCVIIIGKENGCSFLASWINFAILIRDQS